MKQGSLELDSDKAQEHFKYWAFISYARQDNQQTSQGASGYNHVLWGEWLQDTLETYHVHAELVGRLNRYGERITDHLFPIFRDEEDMGAVGSLRGEVENALEKSRWLVVICSPQSAQSLWVNQEIRYFKRLGRGRRILPLIIAGEPAASLGEKVRALASEECFVPALLHPLDQHGEVDLTREDDLPLGADVRWGDAKREILVCCPLIT
jgi:hypothetical protein